METKDIYKTIAAVMQKIEAIAKKQKNIQQKFLYRSIDDVMNELHPLLAECGLFIVPEVLSEERTERQSQNGGTLFYSRQKIKFTFYATDGSHLSAVIIGEAMDSGDKASNKALSIAYKYACLQVFCIPTEDVKDPDGQSYSVATKKCELDNLATKVHEFIDKKIYTDAMASRLVQYLNEGNIDGLKKGIKWAIDEEKRLANENTQQGGQNAKGSIIDHATRV